MNVPNKHKGFSKLPENVQRQMDPSLAQKYQMGGSVMQRPLFRQMGGPAQPMPQDMMPPPPAPAMMPPQGAEQQVAGAEMMGQQVGAQMADDMMMKLDGAEDYQTLIDGIRGNNLPLEARYEELATLVGEQDAMATPESVLALTQPTIMMTEQGAMDSGIGELMQGLSGSVDMEGPMEEGVGSLMMAGAGNTPPVNFRNGGPVEVRRFAEGGESRILTQAERDVADYEKYFAGGFDQQARAAALEEQNKMAKAQMLFDIAGTALNFAGQTQGDSIAERLANAATQTQLTDKIGQRSAGMLSAKQAQQAEERQMRMAARQASLGQAQTDEASRQALLLAAAKAKPGDAKYQRLIGPNGEKLGTFNVSTSDGAARLDAAIRDNPDATLYNVGTEPADSSKSDLKIVVFEDGNQQTFDLSTTDGRSSFEAASKQDGAKVYNVGAAPTDAGYTHITLYDPNNPTKPISRPTNTLEERQAVSDLLKGGYTTDDKVAAATITDEFAQKREERAEVRDIAAEERALKTTLAAEKRLESTTISREERAVLTAIASEGRAEQRLIETEDRLLQTTLGSEARRLATVEAQEARDELAAIRRENRAIQAQIEAEKRNIATTIAAEDRNEQQTIRAEIRELESTLDQEERDAIAPFTKTIGDKLYRIDLSKPEADQITLLVDESTIPDVFGSGTTGKVMSIVSNEDLLSKYANNTLSKEDDGISPTEMEAALVAYTSPTSTAYSADAKSMVSTPGKALTAIMIDALRARKLNGLSVPTGVYFPMDELDAAVDERLGINNGLDQAPPMTEFLGEAAWGSKAFAQNLVNNGLEFFQAPAFFTEAKDAIEAVKNLNQEFETVFLASQEIRDSVYQGKKLEDLTPKPAKFFGTGPDAARSKALNLYERLKRHIQITEAQLRDPNIPMPQTGPGSLQKKQERLQTLKDLQAGYGVLAGLDLLSRGMDPAEIDRSEAEQALIDELDRLSGMGTTSEGNSE